MPELKENEVIVTQEELQGWLSKIKELNQLKADLETDIGWVSSAVDNLINSPNPMKLIPKILMGKVNLKELGLDDERLEKISSKYAPETHKLIQAKKKKS